jgi:hypothetical protein
MMSLFSRQIKMSTIEKVDSVLNGKNVNLLLTDTFIQLHVK